MNNTSSIAEAVDKLFGLAPVKIVLSNPTDKKAVVKRIQIEKKEKYYQIARYTEKQVFHENVDKESVQALCAEALGSAFTRLNAWTENNEVDIRISKKGKIFTGMKKSDNKVLADKLKADNRKKNYILEEGTLIEPLIDMGIFTNEGRVIRSMYDKYRQINRFIEMVDDELKKRITTQLNIIDFGCGKSYLTFIIYYYLTSIKKIKVRMIGLDLKEEVIKKCNAAAVKYGYEGLLFEVGDINGFKPPFAVDMVISLHACDTATDYALYNAISWGAKYIFSVPCCQHEINGQITSEEFSLLTRYGIVKERISALMTDAIRGNLLEYRGYNVNLLEFIDLSHTPKNILIRAVKNGSKSEEARNNALNEAKRVINEYSLSPTLYKLLTKN